MKGNQLFSFNAKFYICYCNYLFYEYHFWSYLLTHIWQAFFIVKCNLSICFSFLFPFVFFFLNIFFDFEIMVSCYYLNCDDFFVYCNPFSIFKIFFFLYFFYTCPYFFILILINAFVIQPKVIKTFFPFFFCPLISYPQYPCFWLLNEIYRPLTHLLVCIQQVFREKLVFLSFLFLKDHNYKVVEFLKVYGDF